MEILKAFYGSLDVKQKVEELINRGITTFYAENGLFGDPNFGELKYFVCEYEFNNIIQSVRILENTSVSIVPLKQSNKLGIYYTDNKSPVIEQTLANLQRINENVQIITCSHLPISNYPFPNVLSMSKESAGYNIVIQILQALYYAKSIGNFDYVSFLEHDVLYPPNYFNYPDFPKTSAAHNKNYMGICSSGFQRYVGGFNALSQTTIHYDIAIEHFEKQLLDRVKGLIPGWIEPIHLDSLEYFSKIPTLHINRPSFSDHRVYFSNETIPDLDYWGNYQTIWR